ncbi:hypothetical protein D3C76_1585260 [compost metagenome]
MFIRLQLGKPLRCDVICLERSILFRFWLIDRLTLFLRCTQINEALGLLLGQSGDLLAVLE